MKEENGIIKEDNIDLPQEGEELPQTQNSGDFHNWQRKSALFLSSQAISLFGSSLVQYAIVWYITLTTKSGPLITISALCGFLPQIAISLFAGVWADRYNRKFLIIISDVLIASATLIMAILFLLGYRELWLLFIVSAVRSVGSGIQHPAVNAFIPQIVPQEKLMKFNGIFGSLSSVMLIISPAVSGALLSFSTLEVTFFIDVVTAAIAVSILSLLKVAPHKKAAQLQNTGYLDDLKAGLKYTGQNRFVRSLLVFYLLFFFLITPVAYLTPLMIARSFGEEVWRLTLNEILYFGGSIIGGLIIGAWGGFKNRIYTLALSCIAFGILTASLGIAGNFIIYLIIMFVTGLVVPFFNSPVTVLLQEKVELDMQGRVFSLVMIVVSVAMPLGMVLFGPAADILKIELLLIITGVLMALLGVSIFYNRGIKSAL